jgi:very-short-patch-repair endonuclease
MSQRTPRPIDKRAPRARALRRDVTEAEKRLWQYLRQPPFKECHFRRQATIGPYFADFASHQPRIVIELDGGQHSLSPSDEVRTRYLEANGYRVLRFWNNDVLANIDGVATQIHTASGTESPPPLTPPHRKRGEGKRDLAPGEPRPGAKRALRRPRKERH